MMMKPRNIRFLSGVLIFVLTLAGLAACASQPSAPVSTATQAPAAVSQMTNTATFPVGATSGTATPAAGAGAAVSFSKDILPILDTACVSCHGGEKTSKGLDLKTYASMMAGSQNGAMIVSGDAANSKLVQSVQSGKMPKRGTKLTADQIHLLIDWVNGGAENN